MQYIYALRNALLDVSSVIVAQMFVCTTDSPERTVEALLIKMAAGGTNIGSTTHLNGHYALCGNGQAIDLDTIMAGLMLE